MGQFQSDGVGQFTSVANKASQFSSNRLVPTNGSGVPCYATPLSFTKNAAKFELHANHIHFDSHQLAGKHVADSDTTHSTYCAAQTPEKNPQQWQSETIGPSSASTTDLMLEQAITSGQGLFQYVSPRAHRYFLNARDNVHNQGPATRDHSLLHSLLERTKQGSQTGPIMFGRYELKALNAVTTPQQASDSDQDHVHYQLKVLDTQSKKELIIPITQYAPTFTNKVLDIERIEKSKLLLNAHRSLQATVPSAAALTPTSAMIMSYAGIGRNATLIAYDQITAMMDREEVNASNLDDVLVKVINQGRLERGPRFIHSEAQFDTLLLALRQYQPRVAASEPSSKGPATLDVEELNRVWNNRQGNPEALTKLFQGIQKAQLAHIDRITDPTLKTCMTMAARVNTLFTASQRQTALNNTSLDDITKKILMYDFEALPSALATSTLVDTTTKDLLSNPFVFRPTQAANINHYFNQLPRYLQELPRIGDLINSDSLTLEQRMLFSNQFNPDSSTDTKVNTIISQGLLDLASTLKLAAYNRNATALKQAETPLSLKISSLLLQLITLNESEFKEQLLRASLPEMRLSEANKIAPISQHDSEKLPTGFEDVTRYLKQHPYFSVKPERSSYTANNGAFTFTHKDKSHEQIVCRHLAFAWIESALRTNNQKKLKPNYKIFKDKNSIQSNIDWDYERKFKTTLAASTETYIENSERFGEFIGEQFSSMVQKNVPAKAFLIASDSHAMSILLKVKYSDDGLTSQYVINFYDPNLTDVHERASGDSVAYCKNWHLKDMFARPDVFESYFGRGENAINSFLAVTLPPPDILSGKRDAPPASSRELTSTINPKSLNSQTIKYLIMSNQGKALATAVISILKREDLGDEEIVNMLSIEKQQLIYMFKGPFSELFPTYIQAVLDSKLSEPAKANLLCPPSIFTPPLTTWFLTGDHEKAFTFCELVLRSSLSDEIKVQLLKSGNSHSTAIQGAFYSKDIKAIEQFVSSVLSSNLNDAMKTDLLSAELTSNDVMTAGVHDALWNNYIEVVRSFAQAILNSKLDVTQKAKLLSAKESNYSRGKAEAVKQLKHLVAKSDLPSPIKDSIIESHIGSWRLAKTKLRSLFKM